MLEFEARKGTKGCFVQLNLNVSKGSHKDFLNKVSYLQKPLLYFAILFFLEILAQIFEDQLLGVCMIDYKLCLVVTPKMLLQCRMGKHSIRQILGYIYQRPSSVETFPIKILGDYK